MESSVDLAAVGSVNAQGATMKQEPAQCRRGVIRGVFGRDSTLNHGLPSSASWVGGHVINARPVYCCSIATRR